MSQPPIFTSPLTATTTSNDGVSVQYHVCGNPAVELLLLQVYVSAIQLTADESSSDDAAPASEWKVVGHRQRSDAHTITEYKQDDPTTPSDDLDLGTDTLLVYDIPTHLTIHDLYTFLQHSLYDVLQLQLLQPRTASQAEQAAAKDDNRDGSKAQDDKLKHTDHSQDSESSSAHNTPTKAPPIAPSSLHSYALLVQLRSTAAAANFVRHHHNQLYNSIETHRCHIAYVWEVQLESRVAAITHTPPNHSAVSSKEQFSHLSFPLPLTIPSNESTKYIQVNTRSSAHDVSSCAVCLDPLDTSNSADGEDNVNSCIGIICGHQFHFTCLSRWSERSCPVCRYAMHPSEVSQCSVCAAQDHLWLCLVCGEVGCGRYSNGHAYEHYQHTGHSYAQNISSRRVWDYESDSYVHRLVRSKVDGKLVEVQQIQHKWKDAASSSSNHHQASAQLKISSQEAETSSKLERLLSEFNYMLASQLEQQRTQFEKQLAVTRQQTQEATTTAMQRLKQQEAAHASNLQQLATLTTSHEQLQQQATELQEQITKSQRESKMLQQLHQRLLEQQHTANVTVNSESSALAAAEQQSLQEKDAVIADLEDQIRDLQFYISTQKKVARSELKHDITAGQLAVAGSADVSDTATPTSAARQRLKARLAVRSKNRR